MRKPRFYHKRFSRYARKTLRGAMRPPGTHRVKGQHLLVLVVNCFKLLSTASFTDFGAKKRNINRLF